MSWFYIFVIVLMCVGCGHSVSATGYKFLSVGTGAMSGVYYQIGCMLCKLVKKYDKQFICSSSSSGGTGYNVNALHNDFVNIAIVQADWASLAYTGKHEFATRQTKELRLIAPMHNEYLTIMVRGDSGIDSISDLKGKRISTGELTSGSRFIVRAFFDIASLSNKDFASVSELSATEQISYLCDKKIDVAFSSFGHPNALLHEATVSCNAKLLSIPKELAVQIHEKYQFYTHCYLPAKTYENINERTSTICVRSLLLTTDRVDDETVFTITKVFNDKIDVIEGFNGR